MIEFVAVEEVVREDTHGPGEVLKLELSFRDVGGRNAGPANEMIEA